MLKLFRAIVARVKLLYAMDAALELEAEFAARCGERRAWLLRRAARYEAEGLAGVAADLRRQAEGIDPRRPLAGTLAVLQHLDCQGQDAAPLPGDDAKGSGDGPVLPQPEVRTEAADARRKPRRAG